VAFLLGAVVLLYVCGLLATRIFHTVSTLRAEDTSRRSPLGRVLDRLYRVRR
jgi:hypothetical protein